jgi:ABC-type nitrate/sulfonate/bicarbonate transport system substrate-binding protein
MIRRAALFASFLVVVAALIGAVMAATSKSSVATQPTASFPELAVGYSQLRISLPVFVAAERGLFAAHGLSVSLRPYNTAQPMMQALAEGKIDLAGYTALPITFDAMLRSNRRLRFLTTVVEDRSHRISYLLRRATPAGQAASPTSVEDLEGKRIGILPTVAYRVWLEAILRAHGVGAAGVTVQTVEPPLQGELLRAGGIDALFTNDPMATSAIRHGVAELLSRDVDVPAALGDPLPFGSFNVSDEWGAAHLDLLARLAAALDEAVEFVNTNPAEARHAMRRYLPEAFRDDVDAYPDSRYWTTRESSDDAYARVAREYRNLGIIPRDIDLTGLVFHAAPAH